MRTAHKVAISLLIAVLVFSGVAVLSFTGFFDFIETNFYNQRVRSSFFNQLDNRADSIKKYHKLQIDRFTSILNEDFVKRIYLPNRSREDIFNQESVLGKLEENVPELLFIRFLDAEGTRIHFSTLEEDIKSRNDFRVVYKTWAEAEYTADPQKLLVSENEEPKVLLDSSLNALIYSFPSYDTYDIYRGSALFYLSTEGLQTHLVEEGVIGVGTNIILTESSGLVFGLPSGYRTEEVREQLNSTIRNFNSEEGMKSLFTTEEGQEYFIFLKKMERGSFTGIVVSGRIFELHPIMKIILLSAVFVTAFLLTYLLFNIKQDVILVLSERIKRFQIKLLSEYIESKDEIQWDRWQKDLQLRRNEVKEEIKRGLGRFSKKKEPEVDALIDQSWDEIIEVMGKRAGAISQESTGNIDMQRLETMLQQIMNKTQFVVPASSTTSAQPQEKPAGTVSAQEPVEVEEVSEETGEEEEIEELEEPEELEEAGSEEETREETEEAPEKAEETPPTELTGEPVEVEEVSEATGEEEEIEELEEPEELEEFESGEETVVAGEEPEEAEGTEESEAAGEPEEPEELEEAEEPEETGSEEETREETEEAPEKAEETPPTELTGEPVEVEEVSEATGEEEEIEELEEPEELEEFESGEETVVAGEEPEEAEAPEEPEGTEEPEAAGEPEEPEELEEAEELEAAGEPEEPEELEEAEEIEEAGSEEETPEEAEEATIQIEEPPEEPEAEELEEVTEETLEEAVDEEVPVEPEPEELEEIEDIEPLEEGEEEVENVEELEEAEDIEDSGQSEGVVEELEAEAGGPLGAFGYNPNQYNISFRQTQFDSTVEGAGMYKGEDEEYEEVESLEEIEELEDLSTTDQGSEREGEETEIEELEELEELEEQKASDTGPTVKRIDDLKQMGKIVSISLREFQLMVNEGGRETTETKSEEPVQEKNGVFSIRDDVFYRDQAGESDQGFAELVDSVLGNEDSEKQEDDETPESNKNAEKGIQASQSGQEDFESVGGIESLFGDETGEDLLFSDEQESEEKTGRESSSLEVGPGPLVDKEGLHFDLLVGKDPERETKIIKALIRFSRVFDGLFSAILEQTDKNLICRYSVGLNEESRNNLVIWKKEELFRDYLEERAAVIINWPLSNIQEMKEKVSEKDRGSIDCILLLPLIYKRNAGYVMVGSNKQSLEGSAIAEALRQWKTDRR